MKTKNNPQYAFSGYYTVYSPLPHSLYRQESNTVIIANGGNRIVSLRQCDIVRNSSKYRELFI